MQINHRIKHVTGAFDTDSGKLVCVQKKKYGEVLLCFAEGWNIPFAEIRLHTEDLAVDSDAVFEDAVNLGKEIVRRWNEYTPPVPIHPQVRSNLTFDITAYPDTRSTSVVGALTIKYAACMSEAECSETIVEKLKTILTERFDLGLHGFDEAIAKHDLGSNGQRIQFRPISPESFFDSTTITQDWLLSVGFKPVPSDMGPTFRDHLELGRLNIWEFNETGEWLYDAADHISLYTRGDVRTLARLLKVELLNDNPSPPPPTNWEDHPAEHAIRDSFGRILLEISTKLPTSACTKQTTDFGFSKGRGLRFSTRQGDYRVHGHICITAAVPRDVEPHTPE